MVSQSGCGRAPRIATKPPCAWRAPVTGQVAGSSVAGAIRLAEDIVIRYGTSPARHSDTNYEAGPGGTRRRSTPCFIEDMRRPEATATAPCRFGGPVPLPWGGSDAMPGPTPGGTSGAPNHAPFAAATVATYRPGTPGARPVEWTGDPLEGVGPEVCIHVLLCLIVSV